MGNMEKNLRFHMTPHLLSITFRITSNISFSSLSARLFFYEGIFESRSRLDLDLDSSLSKIFLQFCGWAGPVGNMEKNLRFHMTPHLLSITFRITTDYKGLNLELKKKLDLFCMVAECT